MITFNRTCVRISKKLWLYLLESKWVSLGHQQVLTVNLGTPLQNNSVRRGPLCFCQFKELNTHIHTTDKVTSKKETGSIQQIQQM